MIKCPFCAGQGNINAAKLVKNDMQIYFCDECNTIWLTLDIKESNCINFKKFLKEYNLKGDQSDLYEARRL
jgi:hypothetical protein